MVESQLEAIARELPAVERLRQVPGIGLFIATALVAFVGDLRRFPSGRHLASYLGLTPREYSTGLRHRLGRISKRGETYLRMLFMHGARAVLARARSAEQPDRLRSGTQPFWSVPTTTRLQWPWPTRWRASPGRFP
jgi:transposase